MTTLDLLELEAMAALLHYREWSRPLFVDFFKVGDDDVACERCLRPFKNGDWVANVHWTPMNRSHVSEDWICSPPDRLICDNYKTAKSFQDAVAT